ncbi:MAG TPA: hypothetical protein VG796_14980 [Verrucomicrobiales bacterium]|jgi:hypothetical protein|nr:hypothetical protein [Verrucomicrobiales bacterium]
MIFKPSLSLALPALALLLPVASHAQLSNYWPVTENSGSTTANTVGGGVNGALFNGAGFVNDVTRGQVLSLGGSGAYVNAGTIPQMTTSNNFTWSFWANSTQGASSNVILGNRYSPATGVDFSPREFIKFTTSQFEYHVNAAGQNIDYADVTAGSWNHFSLVKQGNLMISYRNGIVNGARHITAGTNNSQPLYFGGDQNNESWAGRLDDIATWTSPLPASSVMGIAKGIYTPATAPVAAAPPAKTTVFSDNFSSGLGNWTATNRGLENNVAAGYNAPSINGSNQAVLGGTTTSQFWFGSSLESVASYDASKATTVSVDRVSLSGSGTAYRSSVWIFGDDTHYLHYSQNVGESGWSWNARDDGGAGTNNPTGGGFDISGLDAVTDGGMHNISINLEPTGDPGDVNMYMFLDGNLVSAQGFTNFPSNFKVILTGQARATGDSVAATFDNVTISQVPEPGSAVLAAVCGMGLLRRRRR